MTMLSTNHNSSLSFEDLENFSPMLIGWRKYLFTGTALICVALAYLVQRAVHRSLKQLGTRPINQMIIPSQVNTLFNDLTRDSIANNFVIDVYCRCLQILYQIAFFLQDLK